MQIMVLSESLVLQNIKGPAMLFSLFYQTMAAVAFEICFRCSLWVLTSFSDISLQKDSVSSKILGLIRVSCKAERNTTKPAGIWNRNITFRVHFRAETLTEMQTTQFRAKIDRAGVIFDRSTDRAATTRHVGKSGSAQLHLTIELLADKYRSGINK